MAVPRPPKAVIAGGSVGGLFIGNMLLRQGWATVTVLRGLCECDDALDLSALS